MSEALVAVLVGGLTLAWVVALVLVVGYSLKFYNRR